MSSASKQNHRLTKGTHIDFEQETQKKWLLITTSLVRTISIIIMIGSVIVIGRTIHIDQATVALQHLGEGMGFAGTVIFGGVYVLTALLFIPGSALTLASGAVFGIWLGAALVSIASTFAASLAFLIARYAARSRIKSAAQSRPFFAAVDRAIAEGGWKVVLLLRLSPVIPFSLGNYLFGLTGLRFWSYVLASWIGMMPGTLAYVYLGNLGAKGLAASAGKSSMSLPEWVLLIVGLIATIAVVALLTRLARRELKKYVEEPTTQVDQPEAGSKSLNPAVWFAGALILGSLAAGARMFEPQISDMLKFDQSTEETDKVFMPTEFGKSTWVVVMDEGTRLFPLRSTSFSDEQRKSIHV